MKKILLSILVVIFCFVSVPEFCVGSKEDVADNFNKLLKHTGFIAQLEKAGVPLEVRTLNISKNNVGAMLGHVKSNNHIVTLRLGKTTSQDGKVYLEGFNRVALNEYETLGSKTEELEKEKENLTSEINKLKTKEGYLEELKEKFNKTPPSSDSDKSPSSKGETSSSSSGDSDKSPSSSGETSSSSSSDSEAAKKKYLDKVEKLYQKINKILDEKSKLKDNTKDLDKIKKDLDKITEKFLKRMGDELKYNVYSDLEEKVRYIKVLITYNNSHLKEIQGKIENNNGIIRTMNTLLSTKYQLKTEDQIKAFINWALSKKENDKNRPIVTAINATNQKGDSDVFMLNVLLESIDWDQEANLVEYTYDPEKGINDHTLKLILKMKTPQHYFEQSPKTSNSYLIKSDYSDRMILVLGKDHNNKTAYIKTFYISGCDNPTSKCQTSPSM